MNKALLLAGAACLFAAQAQAVELKPYVSGKVVYSDMQFDGKNRWDTGSAKDKLSDEVWGGSIAAGTSWMVPYGAVRTELEYNLNDTAKKSMTIGRNGPLGEMKLDSQSVMLNAYYDIDTCTKFTPYVGGGIGMAKLKAKISAAGEHLTEDSNNFAWQLGAGVAYALTDNVAIDLGYRYTDMGHVKKELAPDNTYKIEADAHQFLLGARYSF